MVVLQMVEEGVGGCRQPGFGVVAVRTVIGGFESHLGFPGLVVVVRHRVVRDSRMHKKLWWV